MATVALFHSVNGLRPAVVAAGERLQAAGHTVTTPDLFGARVAGSLREGYALMEDVGWDTITRRARAAVSGLPGDTVLAGLSMGAGVVGALLADRRETAGLLLLHGVGGQPADVRAGLPVCLQVADPDDICPPGVVTAWRQDLVEAGADVHVRTYAGVGHLFTDPDTPDHDGQACASAWSHALRFLDAL
ncbi:dienelactone hydrolase family protein [Phycicoccus sp. HDW14]|uniref:dienelactone hydrolase family protein n=1 Tax=Phycicoccus sp. HDW14 TaxID=2714941 RepID=UPI0014084E25|nr:dienelactone hydrolase family protein [Phycicoccus sp. HDW14]QIM19958.1 dienelactone hydrolase family protein [Phycicoccus sp. HDW14]